MFLSWAVIPQCAVSGDEPRVCRDVFRQCCHEFCDVPHVQRSCVLFQVMNHEFVETCSVSADMSSVLFLMFSVVV